MHARPLTWEAVETAVRLYAPTVVEEIRDYLRERDFLVPPASPSSLQVQDAARRSDADELVLPRRDTIFDPLSDLDMPTPRPSER